eukprot:scaffold675485_cov46-Prasinocladus_malaysianus.AAC.1
MSNLLSRIVTNHSSSKTAPDLTSISDFNSVPPAKSLHSLSESFQAQRPGYSKEAKPGHYAIYAEVRSSLALVERLARRPPPKAA